MRKTIGTRIRDVLLVAVVLILVIGAGGATLAVAQRNTSDQQRLLRRTTVEGHVALVALAQSYAAQLFQAQQSVGQTIAAIKPVGGAAAYDAMIGDSGGGLPPHLAMLVTGVSGRPVGGSGPFAAVDAVLASPELAPSLRDLAGGAPVLTSVVQIGSSPSVILGLPMTNAAHARVGALFVAYNLYSWPLEQYVSQLSSPDATTFYMVDAAGRAVSAAPKAGIGRPLPAAVTALAPMSANPELHQSSGSHPLVVISVSTGFAGWRIVSSEPAPAFYGATWRANTGIRWGLLALLVITASGLLILHVRRQAAVQALADMATIDALTGLPNRVAFTRELESALARHRREGTTTSLLFLDLDGFKQVNDEFGHGVGDLLLVAVAKRLRGAVERVGGGKGRLARLGGDEFTCLLDQPGDQVTEQVVDAITDAVAEPFILAGREVRVGVSIGVAHTHPDGDLLRDADLAMYRAKAQRKATVAGSAAMAAAPGSSGR